MREHGWYIYTLVFDRPTLILDDQLIICISIYLYIYRYRHERERSAKRDTIAN